MDTHHFLIFETDNQLYGLPLQAIREVIHTAKLICPPDRPQFLQGFLDLSGQLIAVVDLRTLWNLPAQEPTLYTPLIVLAGQKFALQVDHVENVVTLAPGACQPIEKNRTLNDCVEAKCAIAENPVQILNMDKLLLLEEQNRLADLKQKMETRKAHVEMHSS